MRRSRTRCWRRAYADIRLKARFQSKTPLTGYACKSDCKKELWKHQSSFLFVSKSRAKLGFPMPFTERLNQARLRRENISMQDELRLSIAGPVLETGGFRFPSPPVSIICRAGRGRERWFRGHAAGRGKRLRRSATDKGGLRGVGRVYVARARSAGSAATPQVLLLSGLT